MTGTHEESLDTAEPGDDLSRGFHWRVRHTVFTVIVVILAAVIAASLISIPYYALTPGTAQSVEKLIGLPGSMEHQHKGEFLLVDVEETPLRAIEWPFFKLNPNAQILPSSELLGTETAAQYETEGELDMSDAQQAATVVALDKLGYHVKAQPDGTLLYGVLPDSPASQSLAVGEVVVSVDGHSTLTTTALEDRLQAYKAGDKVTMTVLSYPAKRKKTVSVTLSTWRVKGKGKTATLVCPPYRTGTKYPVYKVKASKTAPAEPASCLGVDVEPSYKVSKLPFRVDLNNEGIVGPSAGLAFTLGLIERLDPDDLTGGHKIAATGTMSINGAVGAIGGVAQKTVAVRAAGAKVFFVPLANYKTALKHDGNGLKIYAVSSLGEVIKILETHYGGKLASPAKGS